MPLPAAQTKATYLKFQVLERPDGRRRGGRAQRRRAGRRVGAVDERPIRVDASGDVDDYVERGAARRSTRSTTSPAAPSTSGI